MFLWIIITGTVNIEHCTRSTPATVGIKVKTLRGRNAKITAKRKNKLKKKQKCNG